MDIGKFKNDYNKDKKPIYFNYNVHRCYHTVLDGISFNIIIL